MKKKQTKEASITIRLPVSIKEELQELRDDFAEESGIYLTLSSFLLFIIENFLDEESKNSKLSTRGF